MTITMLFDPVGHVDDEALDLFCGERLSPEDDEAVRQHLRFCEECRNRADTESYFHSAIVEHRDLFEAPQSSQDHPPNLRRVRPFWKSLFLGWRPAIAFASVAMAVLLLPRLAAPPASTAPVDVTLEAMRGDAAPAVGAPAGHPLRLKLDLSGLASLSGVEVQVVDRLGQAIARGPAQLDREQALFTVNARIPAGQYWVRLWQGEELVREYSLRVR